MGKLLKINNLEDDLVLKKQKNMNFFEKIKNIVQQKQKNKLKKEQEMIVPEEEKVQFEIDLDKMQVEKKMEFTKKNRESLYFLIFYYFLIFFQFFF